MVLESEPIQLTVEKCPTYMCITCTSEKRRWTYAKETVHISTSQMIMGSNTIRNIHFWFSFHTWRSNCYNICPDETYQIAWFLVLLMVAPVTVAWSNHITAAIHCHYGIDGEDAPFFVLERELLISPQFKVPFSQKRSKNGGASWSITKKYSRRRVGGYNLGQGLGSGYKWLAGLISRVCMAELVFRVSMGGPNIMWQTLWGHCHLPMDSLICSS